MRRLIPASLVAVVLLVTTIPLAAQLAWTPSERGLEGADILAMHATPTGAVIAEGRHGLYRLGRGAERWDHVLDTLVESAWQFANASGGVIHAVGDARHHRSDDDGRTWLVVESSGAVVATADDGAGGTVIIGDLGTSTDGGATWTPVFPGNIVALVAIAPGRFLAFTGAGPRIWDAGLREWMIRNDLTQRAPLISLGGGVLIAAAPSGTGGVEHSLDTGEGWRFRRGSYTPQAFARLADGSVVMTVFDQGRTQPESDGLYHTSDSGMTWTRISAGGYFPIAATSEGIWARTIDGMALSTDRGATWTLRSAGIHERRVEVRSDRDGTFWALAEPTPITIDPSLFGMRRLLRSSDGRSWRRVLDSVQVFRSLDSGLLAASTIGTREVNGVGLIDFATRVSSDGGDSWRTLAPWRLVHAARGPLGMAAVVVEPINAGDTNLFVTTDSARTWRRFAVPGYPRLVAFNDTGAVLVATDPRKVFTGAQTLGISFDTVITKKRVMSRDTVIAGDTVTVEDTVTVRDTVRKWTTIRDSIDIEGMTVFGDSVIVLVQGPQAFGYAIDRSTDGGRTWASRHGDATKLAAMRLVDTAIVLVWHTDTGVVVERSLDSGATWQRARIDDLISIHTGPWFSGTGELYALRPDGMIRSRDHGMTWRLVDREIVWQSVASSATTIIAQHPSRGVWVAEDVPSGVEIEMDPELWQLDLR